VRPAGRSQFRALSREWPRRFLSGRNSTKVEALAHEITARGGEGSAAQVDTRPERAVEEYIASVASRSGQISVATIRSCRRNHHQACALRVGESSELCIQTSDTVVPTRRELDAVEVPLCARDRRFGGAQGGSELSVGINTLTPVSSSTM
jgi:hypothetical protein